MFLPVLVTSHMLSVGGVMNCTCLHALEDYRDPMFIALLLSASHVSIDSLCILLSGTRVSGKQKATLLQEKESKW